MQLVKNHVPNKEKKQFSHEFLTVPKRKPRFLPKILKNHTFTRGKYEVTKKDSDFLTSF